MLGRPNYYLTAEIFEVVADAFATTTEFILHKKFSLAINFFELGSPEPRNPWAGRRGLSRSPNRCEWFCGYQNMKPCWSNIDNSEELKSQDKNVVFSEKAHALGTGSLH